MLQSKNFCAGLILLVLSCLFAPAVSYGQGGSSVDPYGPMLKIINQDFFRQYLKVKERAENSVKLFKAVSQNYSADEAALIQASYNQAASMFNFMIDNIKDDLLSSSQRKYIFKNPGDYAKQVECDFRRARDFYDRTYAQDIRNLTNNQITAAFDPATIELVLQAAGTAWKILKEIKKEIKKMQEKYVNEQFVERYRFKSWDEIN